MKTIKEQINSDFGKDIIDYFLDKIFGRYEYDYKQLLDMESVMEFDLETKQEYILVSRYHDFLDWVNKLETIDPEAINVIKEKISKDEEIRKNWPNLNYQMTNGENGIEWGIGKQYLVGKYLSWWLDNSGEVEELLVRRINEKYGEKCNN